MQRTRRPATEEDLAKIPVSDAEEEEFWRNLRTLFDSVARVVGVSPIVGVALLRAGAQGASLAGLPPEDFMRMVCYALDRFPARGQPQAPTEAELEQVFPLCRQLMHISAAALRKAPAADIIGLQLYAAVSILRFNGLPDDAVLKLAEVSLADADAATESYMTKHAKADA